MEKQEHNQIIKPFTENDWFRKCHCVNISLNSDKEQGHGKMTLPALTFHKTWALFGFPRKPWQVAW